MGFNLGGGNLNVMGGITITFALSPILEALVKAQASTEDATLATLARLEIKLDAAILQERLIMDAITSFAGKVNANFASIKTGIQSLDDKIVAFQNSPGTLTPADQAALDAIQADSATLATAANAIVPVPTPVPVP